MTTESLDAQGLISEIKNLLKEAMVKAVIKNANPQSVTCLSGLRYSHLQAVLCDQPVEDLAAFATFVFSSHVLPQVFWTLHTSANLSTMRQKARPVACGDVLQRVIDAVFCRRYKRKLADYFQPWSHYGVAVSGGVYIMALTATLGFEKGLHHSLVRRSKRLQQHIPPHVPVGAGGNRPLRSPLRVKPVRTRTPETLVCIRWRRFERG